MKPLERLRRGPRGAAHDVFILGSAYSGSTLLGNALNGHSAIRHLGELSRLPEFGVGDITDHCVLCATAGQECPVWTPELLAAVQAAGPGDAHRVLRDRLGGPQILVDGSKRITWFEQCIDGAGSLVSPFALVSVRHPFAFADSCRRRIGLEPHYAAREWRHEMHTTMGTLVATGIPFLVVRYEDLARDPAWMLGRVADSLGLMPEPGLTEFWKHDCHPIGGNAGAHMWFESFRDSASFENDEDREVANSYVGRPFGGWVDDKWTTNLDEAARAAIVAYPGLVETAAVFGYEI